ncbi:hypothetical protein EJ04DRAFT_558810 [Polyplosphaeria fusca]|uniref:Uncharacterized protein n=1 Tax=Polyplosphaeria fusca TaxID=682080 RepID=A0A9P4R8C1_9PLEO|nr:hypothetical protein EJ04DRAFT_558810 [Polyplosphaeria fusca]
MANAEEAEAEAAETALSDLTTQSTNHDNPARQDALPQIDQDTASPKYEPLEPRYADVSEDGSEREPTWINEKELEQELKGITGRMAEEKTEEKTEDPIEQNSRVEALKLSEIGVEQKNDQRAILKRKRAETEERF